MSDSIEPDRILRTDSVQIPPRFNGQPGIGQGGYSAALAAQPLEGAVAVDLRRPVPLGRPLRRNVMENGRVELRDGDTLIAEARRTDLALEIPAAPGWEESVQAATRYPGFEFHPYDTCFGCGTQRGEGDGLRIFSAPRAGGDGYAAPWVPHQSFASEDGRVFPELIWAALDCPSGWVATPVLGERFPAGARIVTGQLAVRIDAPVHAGARYTSLGWLVGTEGRKLFTGTALYDEGGAPVAVGSAIWIVILPKA